MIHTINKGRNNLSDYQNDLLEVVEIPIYTLEAKKLPKSAKDNLTKSGKRKPINLAQCQALYDTLLDAKSFQRIARPFFKTSRIGGLVTLWNEITNTPIVINFLLDKHNYMKVNCFKNGVSINIKAPTYNRQLFEKIIIGKYF